MNFSSINLFSLYVSHLLSTFLNFLCISCNFSLFFILFPLFHYFWAYRAQNSASYSVFCWPVGVDPLCTRYTNRGVVLVVHNFTRGPLMVSDNYRWLYTALFVRLLTLPSLKSFFEDFPISVLPIATFCYDKELYSYFSHDF